MFYLLCFVLGDFIRLGMNKFSEDEYSLSIMSLGFILLVVGRLLYSFYSLYLGAGKTGIGKSQIK